MLSIGKCSSKQAGYNLQVEDEAPVPYIDSILLQIRYNIGLLDKNWKPLGRESMLPTI